MTPLDPYPDRDAPDVTDVSYFSPLSLIRPPALLLDRMAEDGDYVVQRDYDLSLRIDGDVRVLTVPRGLITDLTSVPAPLRWVVGRVGPWLEAAIVHDYLYVAWRLIPGREPLARDRAFADLVMLRAMEAARVGALRRWIIYGAVRLFGGPAYRDRRGPIFADLDSRAFDTPIVIPAA